MRVAITGADGQLGFELCRQLGDQALPIYGRDVDITSSTAVRAAMRELQPDAVINTAAYTDVDGAESEPDRCSAVNVEGTRHLAEVCRAIGARLVQVSTDYVFSASPDRRRPLREDDAPNPQGVYARSKLESERVTAASAPDHLIVRTCGLYVNRDSDRVRNFAKTMLRLASERECLRVVDDQHCTPSYVPHVARAVVHLLTTGQRGIVHLVNSGATTWYGFAVELFRQAEISIPVEPIVSADYPTAAARPSYSVLDTSRYGTLGGPDLPPWQVGIAEYLSVGTPSVGKSDFDSRETAGKDL